MLDDLPPYLNLLQSVAWICTRRLGVVLRADPAARHDTLTDLPRPVVESCFPPHTGFLPQRRHTRASARPLPVPARIPPRKPRPAKRNVHFWDLRVSVRAGGGISQAS